ncbi:MAG TPA: TIM-barrel domain-containing protein [Flavisolibacter sp.]|nr:TIM-barrel domain-containing protein [Flavisolibacter sp.]
MRERKIFVLLLFVLTTVVVRAGDFIKTADGVIVHPDAFSAGNIKEVRLRVLAETIIRVTASAKENAKEDKSLSVLPSGTVRINWKLLSTERSVTVRTSMLVAVVDLTTGAVSFFDPSGKKLLAEAPRGRLLQPIVFEGEPLYHIVQRFDTSPDDAWYGLGQHQDDLMNYRSYQVQLFQNNTEVAVPFVISKKNYGILWDNYSLTQFGDVRAYQSLNALKLFSKDGNEGWLTATYFNDKNDTSVAATERAESSIGYEFLNDSKLFLPSAFKPQNGMTVWEGDIASGQSGVHKFRFTYAGYVRVWIGHQLLLDRWRQAWNPGSAILDVALEQGKKYEMKIEWIPNGGESYLSCKWLPPLTEKELNGYSFSSEAGTGLDYYFIGGKNMDSVISGYRRLTGKATMLPSWAFGKWQSRERYKTQRELLDVVDEFRKRRIPLDNIVQDWSYWKETEWGNQEFDPSRFPNPDSMIRVLHDQYHTHFMISVWPKFYEGIDAYKKFDAQGWLYKRNVADRQRDWINQGYVSTFYDAFNMRAQKGFWDLINGRLYQKGVDAWWMDASEPDILSNVNPEKRKQQMTPTALGPAALYLNAYPLENARGIYEGQRATNPASRVFILTRSAFAGMQRYAAATWSGDIASRWHDMKTQITAGLNFSMSGLPYWTMDIGGFAVEQRFEHPDEKALDEWRELVTRWYQFGAFVPLFRVHGQFPYREIYNVAPAGHPAYESMLFYDRLRYRLMPYIYSVAGAVYENNYTMMRALVLDFPSDTAVTSLKDEYLFGPSLLVSPVYQYKLRKKEVYLPGNSGWYDIYSGRFFEGGRRMTIEAPYERMPLFVREGSIIPLGPVVQYVGERPADTLTIRVYTGKNASFNLYEDEGTNYNYEKGLRSVIRLSYDENSGSLTIDKRVGNFPGMLTHRNFKIVWITKGDPVQLEVEKDGTLVKYSGEKLIVKRKSS